MRTQGGRSDVGAGEPSLKRLMLAPQCSPPTRLHGIGHSSLELRLSPLERIQRELLVVAAAAARRRTRPAPPPPAVELPGGASAAAAAHGGLCLSPGHDRGLGSSRRQVGGRGARQAVRLAQWRAALARQCPEPRHLGRLQQQARQQHLLEPAAERSAPVLRPQLCLDPAGRLRIALSVTAMWGSSISINGARPSSGWRRQRGQHSTASLTALSRPTSCTGCRA